MPEPLATPEDLADMWRPLLDTEISRATNLLTKASAMLRQATRQTIDERIALFATAPTDPRAVDPLIAATVVATIVKRFISNVDGAVSKTEGVGPYSTATSWALRGDKDVRGEMQVTQSDIDALTVEVPAQVGSFMVGESPTLRRGRLLTTHHPGQVYAAELVSFAGVLS